MSYRHHHHPHHHHLHHRSDAGDGPQPLFSPNAFRTPPPPRSNQPSSFPLYEMGSSARAGSSPTSAASAASFQTASTGAGVEYGSGSSSASSSAGFNSLSLLPLEFAARNGFDQPSVHPLIPQYPKQMQSYMPGSPLDRSAPAQKITPQPFAGGDQMHLDMFTMSPGFKPVPNLFRIWEPIPVSSRQPPQAAAADRIPRLFPDVPQERQKTTLSASPPSERCSNCEEATPGVGFCVECSEVLCQLCVVAHGRVRITRKHQIVGLDQNNSATTDTTTSTSTRSHSGSTNQTDSPTSFIESIGPAPKQLATPRGSQNSQNESKLVKQCSEHKSPCLAVCNTCAGANACLTCLQVHTKHDVKIIAAGEPQVALVEETQNFLNSLKSAEAKINHRRSQLESSGQRLLSDIDEAIDAYIAVLNERRSQLHKRASFVQQCKLDLLDSQRQSLESKLNLLGEALSIAKSHPLDPEAVDQLLRAHVEASVPLVPVVSPLLRLSMPPSVADETDDDASTTPTLMASLSQIGTIESGICSRNSKLIGSRFKRLICGRPCVVNVELRDVCNQLVDKGLLESDEYFGATLCGPLNGGDEPEIQHAQILERESSVCSFMFTPQKVGLYRLNVTHCQTSLSGCPTEITISSGRDYRVVQAEGQRFCFGSEGAQNGELSRPWGICCDHRGRILVADRGNHRIQIFDAQGKFLSKFGVYGTRPGEFNRPAGICVNPSNHIIVADKDNHRIQVFSEAGRYIFGFGSRGCGRNHFNYPWGVACNNSHEIAVTDTRNHRIQVFNSKGALLKVHVIEIGIKRSPSSPRGIAYLPDGDLVVTDFNTHRLVVIDSDGKTQCYGLEGTAPGCFYRPQGMAVDSDGLLLVCDSRSHRVQVLSITDSTVVALFGDDSKAEPMTDTSIDKFLKTSVFRYVPVDIKTLGDAPTPNVLQNPMDICVSPDGLVYVVDFDASCVRVY